MPKPQAKPPTGIEAPVALKIRSRDIIHKSDVGGVALNLRGVAPRSKPPPAAWTNKVRRALPKARREGFIVQEMVVRPGAFELIAGVTADADLRPGDPVRQGGTAVEIVDDKSLEFPPLNSALARAQIERQRHILDAFSTSQANVLARRKLIGDVVLKDDADLIAQIVRVILTHVRPSIRT